MLMVMHCSKNIIIQSTSRSQLLSIVSKFVREIEDCPHEQLELIGEGGELQTSGAVQGLGSSSSLGEQKYKIKLTFQKLLYDFVALSEG